jgi:hypothetical protein
MANFDIAIVQDLSRAHLSAWRSTGSQPDQVRFTRTGNIFTMRLSTFEERIVSFLLSMLNSLREHGK